MRSASSVSSKARLGFLIVAVLCVEAGLGQAQEPPKQEQPKYTAEEYKAFQEATTETDPAKKIALIVQFLKDRPQSALRQHVIAAYQAQMNEFQSGKKWSDVISAGDSFLAAVPDDIFTIALLATAYQQTKDLKKFVVYGEKVFEKNPQGNTAYYLAKAYLDLDNNPKFLYWGEKTAQFFPDNHEILIELTKKFAAAKKNAQAAKYGRQCVKALQSAKKPDGTSDKDWKAYTSNSLASCHAVVGTAAHEQGDWATAVSNLESSLKYYGHNDIAYYYLALSYWQLQKVDLAMKNFAKAYLLKGNTSKAAKQYLDNLYKSSHQNTLVGLERVIAKAQEELQ